MLSELVLKPALGGSLCILLLLPSIGWGFQHEPFDLAALRPFTAGTEYQGFATGLYPGAKNQMPGAHRKAGESVASTIRPLDADGRPNARSGKILALVLGHSNCSMYFRAFQAYLESQRALLHPSFELFNAAVGGQQLPQIVRLSGSVWANADRMLAGRPGYSAKQVQVLFLHTTYHGAGNRQQTPPGRFPETMRQMQRDLATVLKHCLEVYPNLKIAYLTCDGLRHFTNFEPHVYREAFAMKWLIESQINHEPGTAFVGADRQLPWLEWGPYIWDNAWDRSFFTDGVHPAPKAQQIFVDKYWDHLRRDSVARFWLFRSGGVRGPLP